MKIPSARRMLPSGLLASSLALGLLDRSWLWTLRRTAPTVPTDTHPVRVGIGWHSQFYVTPWQATLHSVLLIVCFGLFGMGLLRWRKA